MAKKKKPPKQKAVRKKKAASRPKPARQRLRRKKKAAPKRTIRREISSGTETSSLGSSVMRGANPRPRRGMGEEAAGQSGDLQGLSEVEDSNAESVEELLEEGQAFEAEVVDAVENTPDPERGELHTHERPKDEFSSEEEQ